MSQKRRPSKQQQVIVKEGLYPKPAQTEQDRLALAQVHNLSYIEEWAVGMPTVNGVPIVQALTYDLVQILNRACLNIEGQES